MSCRWCEVGQCQINHAPRKRRGGSRKGRTYVCVNYWLAMADHMPAFVAKKKGPRANEGHGETSATGRS